MDIGEARKTILKQLRQQAEKAYLAKAEDFEKTPPADVQRLIHELTLEMVELDRENEETSRTCFELKKEHAQYISLFDFAPVGYFDLDRDHVIRRANFMSTEMLGVSRLQLVGTSFVDFIVPKDMDIFTTCCKDILQYGRVQRCEVEMHKRDGDAFYAQLQVVGIYDGTGIAYRVSAVDVTEQVSTQKALKESENRFRSALDAMLEGCIIVDFNWRYLYVNDAATRLGRRGREQRLGRTMMEVYPGIEKQETFAKLKKCMESRIREQYETEFTFPEGIKAWFEVRVEPVPEGILVFYVDITERKQKETASPASRS